MKRAMLILLAVVMCAGNAWARDLELEKLIISCSNQETDGNKVKCLEELATKLTELHKKKLESNTESYGNWRINRKISHINDSKVFIASLPGIDELKNERAILVLRCSENKTSSYIVWKDILDYNGDNHVVEYRIDTNNPIKNRWNLSVDNKATFAPLEIKFAKSLGGAKKLIARTSYFNKSPAIITFELEGIDGVLKELQETCNWK